MAFPSTIRALCILIILTAFACSLVEGLQRPALKRIRRPGFRGSNTSTHSRDETHSATVTDVDTLTLTRSRVRTRTHNISHSNPIFANITVGHSLSTPLERWTLEQAILRAIRALHPGAAVAVQYLRIRRIGVSSAFASFTFRNIDVRLDNYENYFRALLIDFEKPSGSFLRGAGVTSFRIRNELPPTFRFDFIKTTDTVRVMLTMSRAGVVHYALHLQLGTGPLSPAAPTAAQLRDPAYARANTNTNQGNLMLMGAKVCRWPATSCVFQIFSIASLSGRTYHVYGVMQYERGLGSAPVQNHTTALVTSSVVSDFSISSISGSVFDCDKAVLTYSCADSNIANSNCLTVTGMQTTCSISVRNTGGTTAQACVKGTNCLGISNHPGHFDIEVLRGDNNADVKSFTVANRLSTGSSGTLPVLGNQASGAPVLADGTTQTINFVVNAPTGPSVSFVTVLKIRVKLEGTSTFLALSTQGGGTEKIIRMRDITPDSNTELNCTSLQGPSTFSSGATGRVVAMPASLTSTHLGQNSIIAGVPSNTLCSGNCISSIRCTIHPRQGGVSGRGHLSDFAPFVEQVQGNVANVSVTTLRAGSGSCDCSSFIPQTISQCTCSDNTYTFDILAAPDVLRVPNLQRVQLNISNVVERSLTMDFQLNYGIVPASSTIDIGCNTTGSSAIGHILFGRSFTCYLAVRETANNRAYPIESRCVRVSTSNATWFPALSSVSPIRSEGVFFSFTGTAGEYGSCQGENNLICPFTVTLGEGCGSTVQVNRTLRMEHGLPTAASNVTCTGIGLSSGNIRVGTGSASCVITPRDNFGIITCCRGTAQPFVLTASNGATITSPVVSGDFKFITATLTPPSQLPVGGNVTIQATVNSAAMTPATVFLVDYPTANSTLNCSTTTLVSLQTVTCSIFVFKGPAESFGDVTDFLTMITNGSGAITNLRTNTSSHRREILFDLTAPTVPEVLEVGAWSRYSAGNITRASDDIRFNMTSALRGSPLKISVAYGTPTTATTLICSSFKINALQFISCTIEVQGATGKTAVNPNAIPFVVRVLGDFSVSDLRTKDGSIIQFNITAKSAASIGNVTSVEVLLNGSNITGSHYGPVTVVGEPNAANTTMTCNHAGATVRPGQNLTCTITPGNSGGPTKALPTSLEVTATSSTLPGPLSTADNGSTYTFVWMAPTDVRTLADFQIRLNVDRFPSAVVRVVVSPSDPSNVTSTLVCSSYRFSNATVEIQRPTLCTVELKDANGFSITHVLASELSAFSESGTASSFEELRTATQKLYRFNFTSNSDVPVTAKVDVKLRTIFVQSFNVFVVYGSPTASNSTFTCPNNIVTPSGLVCTVTAKDYFGFTTSPPGAFEITSKGGCHINVTRAPKGDTIAVNATPSTTNPSSTCELTATIQKQTLSSGIINLNVSSTLTPAPTAVVLPFPRVSLQLLGMRGVTSSGVAVYSPADNITVIAAHDAVPVDVTYTWTVNGLVQTAKTARATFGPYTTGVTISVKTSASGYVDGQSSPVTAAVVSPPTGGHLTVNATRVNALSRVQLTCTNWSVSSGISYVFATVERGQVPTIVGESTSNTFLFTAPFESGTASVNYTLACFAVLSEYGLRSSVSANVTISVTPVNISAAEVSNIIASVRPLSLTTPPTPQERAQFSSDINAAASALRALTNVSGTAANDLISTLGRSVSALSNAGLSEAEKDIYSRVVQQAMEKVSGNVTAELTTNVLSVMEATARVPLSSRGASSVLSTVDRLVSLLLKPTSRRIFRDLAVDARTRNMANAYRSAFNAARAYLFSPGVALGTKWSVTTASFSLDSIVDVESLIANAYPQQRIQLATFGTSVLAAVHFNFVTPPVNASRQIAFFGFAVGNATAFLPKDITLNLANLPSNLQVNSYDLDKDTYVACSIANNRAICGPRITDLPPVYYAVSTVAVPTAAPPVTQPATAAPTQAPSVTPRPTTRPPVNVSSTPAPPASSSNVGMIVGIIVGVGGALILGAVALFCFLRRRRDAKNEEDTTTHGPDQPALEFQQPHGNPAFSQHESGQVEMQQHV